MNSDLLARIRKLLNVAACPSASPGEAANAMNLATRLAEKEGLSLGDIPPDHDAHKSPLTHGLAPASRGPVPVWAANIVSSAIGTESLFLRRGGKTTHMIFVGLPEQVEISVDAYTFLMDAMNRSYRAQKKLNPSIKRSAYMYGFLNGVNSNLRSSIQRPGLVLAAKEYVKGPMATALNADYNPRLSTGSRAPKVDPISYHSGVADGKSTDCGPAYPKQAPAPIIPPAAPAPPSPKHAPIRRMPSSFL